MARAIYAQLAFVQFAPAGISQTAYLAEVLGHAENSLTTALSYQKFSIRRKLEETDIDVKGQVTTLEAEFKTFKKEVLEKRPNFNDFNHDPQNLRKVTFQGKDGKTFEVFKQPRIRDKNDEKMFHGIDIFET